MTLPGYEINQTSITSPASVTDTLEATATALISPGALTFDGSPVRVQFFCAKASLPTAAIGNTLTVTLFEGATQITRLAVATAESIATQQFIPIYAEYEFTPSAGSHTYKVCAFVTSTTGVPALYAGSGGTGGIPPAFVRFLKV